MVCLRTTFLIQSIPSQVTLEKPKQLRRPPSEGRRIATYLCGDLKLLVLLQQLLRVLDAGARGGVRGQVELPVVMDPL